MYKEVQKKYENITQEHISLYLSICTSLNIFCIFGAPAILQSDNGREFANSIITELAVMWNGLKIVHGKPRHSQSQSSVERANRDIEDILFSWMEENCTSKWSEGLRFVQVRKNNTLHHGLKCSPYEVMFGQCMKIGLKTSNIPTEILPGLISEENLDVAMSNQQQQDNSFDILEHQYEERTEIPMMREERAAVPVSSKIDDEDIADVEEECEFAQRDVVDAEVMQDEFERGIGMEEETEDDENSTLSPTLCQRQIRITQKCIFERENLKL